MGPKKWVMNFLPSFEETFKKGCSWETILNSFFLGTGKSNFQRLWLLVSGRVFMWSCLPKTRKKPLQTSLPGIESPCGPSSEKRYERKVSLPFSLRKRKQIAVSWISLISILHVTSETR